jgi:pimeloyl-ACP methyl ester carboxylesterase
VIESLRRSHTSGLWRRGSRDAPRGGAGPKAYEHDLLMNTTWENQVLSHQIHALVGGKGSAVVLLPGWPQTAEAYGEIFPVLAQHHKVFAMDPPGLGESGPSTEGYDTAHIARVLADAAKGSLDAPYHLVGHDVGAWIAYAWAAQFPDLIKSLTLLDASIPGCSPPRTFPLPYEVNIKLWQFSFNALPELPEILTRGRERELFDWLFNKKSRHPERISSEHRDRYVECYSRTGAMSNGFAYYRAASQSAQQNLEFSRHKLPMPVLALGGEIATGELVRQATESLALRVQGGVIPDCGHYVMEEQPEQVAATLLPFFAAVEEADV